MTIDLDFSIVFSLQKCHFCSYVWKLRFLETLKQRNTTISVCSIINKCKLGVCFVISEYLSVHADGIDVTWFILRETQTNIEIQ